MSLTARFSNYVKEDFCMHVVVCCITVFLSFTCLHFTVLLFSPIVLLLHTRPCDHEMTDGLCESE